MAIELVNSATNEKLKDMDLMKNIEICELVSRDQGRARDVVKAIKKRVGNKSSNTQVLAVMLLEMLMNNCGEHVYKHVIDTGLLPILVKIVKKKSDLPVREKILLLLDDTQTSLGGASAKFPQYYAAYYDLMSSGIQFPQRSSVLSSDRPKAHKNNVPKGEHVSSKVEGVTQQANPHVSENSILQKASSALEVLREVLNAIDARNPEVAQDEFTLDLVEQCSFQKQRVMHLAMTSRDDKIVSQAIELNDQLQKALLKHDALLSVRPTPTVTATATATHVDHDEQEEEEEAERLFRRIQKGKACLRHEDEDQLERPLSLFGSIQAERLRRPLIRSPQEPTMPCPTSAIPPPPAKHIERERFFQQKRTDHSVLPDRARDLTLHSRNTSSSGSGSIDSSEWFK